MLISIACGQVRWSFWSDPAKVRTYHAQQAFVSRYGFTVITFPSFERFGDFDSWLMSLPLQV